MTLILDFDPDIMSVYKNEASRLRQLQPDEQTIFIYLCDSDNTGPYRQKHRQRQTDTVIETLEKALYSKLIVCWLTG